MTTKLPETIPFKEAFLSVLDRVMEDGYSILYVAANHKEYDGSKEEFDADLSNAVVEAVELLGVPYDDDPESLGELLDIAGSAGICWEEMNGEEEEEEYDE